MHHQRMDRIDDKARVWVVTRSPDGRLQEQVDQRLLSGLHPGQSAQEVAETLVRTAGELELAETRLW